MTTSMNVYLEVGAKRVFAGALDWPGWSRSGKTPEAALETLAEYGRRYAAAIKRARVGFKAPKAGADFRVVERLKGNATTDFGAPGIAPKFDSRPVDGKELARLRAILRASWAALDAAAEAARSKTLRKGPRGGGRDLGKIVRHVFEADAAYLHGLGGKYRGRDAEELHAAFLDTLESRARGVEPPMGRRTAPLWTPRYAVRRSAWHALDHAWEIEDRSS